MTKWVTKIMTKWVTKFPKKAGNYWFYGYRYGKISCGHPNKPEWMVIKVRKITNGMMATDSNGQFFVHNETIEAHYLPLEMPDFPQVSEPFKESCKHCHGHGTDSFGDTCPKCLGECGS